MSRLGTAWPRRSSTFRRPCAKRLIVVAISVLVLGPAMVPALASAKSSPHRAAAHRTSLTHRTQAGARPLAPGAGIATRTDRRAVRGLQRRLRRAGLATGPIDGRFGPITAEAVMGLQRARGLTVDGVVGPRTRGALNAAAHRLGPGAGYGLRHGSTAVRRVQRSLRAAGAHPGPIDGLYGPRTTRAVERLQRRHHLAQTGNAGHATLVVLGLTRAHRRHVSSVARRRPPRRVDVPASVSAHAGGHIAGGVPGAPQVPMALVLLALGGLGLMIALTNYGRTRRRAHQRLREGSAAAPLGGAQQTALKGGSR